MYAIVKTGGKQYRVEEGRALKVDRLPAQEGERVELSDVLLIADDGEVTVGTPTIDGARVVAEVAAQGRHKKIVVFKYKAKVRTRKKTGHRQPFTQLLVQEILRPGQEAKAAEKPKRRRAAKAEAEPEAVAPSEEPKAEAPAVEEKPKRRTTRKAAAPKAEAPATEAEAKPARRTRKKADEPKAEASDEAEAKPKRRTSRKTKKSETE